MALSSLKSPQISRVDGPRCDLMVDSETREVVVLLRIWHRVMGKQPVINDYK